MKQLQAIPEIVSVNGSALSCYVYGQGNRDLFFVHGYLGQVSIFEEFFAALAAHFRITALDLRAHGNSSQITENFTLNQLAEDIITVTNTLKLDSPFYVGHSLGGLLGLLSELKRPGLFKALALITPGPAKAGGSNPKVSEQSVRVHRNREAMRESIRSFYVRDVTEENLSRLVESACLVDPDVHEQYLTREWPKHDILEQLGSIKSPVLLLNGALDNVISSEAQHQMAMQLPNCKEVIFSDEGHMLPLEAPERAVREIINFYKNDLEG